MMPSDCSPIYTLYMLYMCGWMCPWVVSCLVFTYVLMGVSAGCCLCGCWGQVSKQAVQMVSDGLLDTSADRARLKKDRAPVTR